MPLLPKPYPDELIGSVLARASWRTGMPLKRLLQSAYRSSRGTSSVLMGAQVHRLASLAGMDAAELLMQHTVLPYTTAFMSGPQRAAFQLKALSLRAPEESLASLARSVSHGTPHWRFCPQCVREDLQTFGESYWRRAHLLPGALVCLRHGRLLRNTMIPMRGNVQTAAAVLPGDVEGVPLRPRVGPITLLALAQASYDALTWAFPGRDAWPETYREWAHVLGFTRPGNDVAARPLAAAVHRFYGSAFLEETGCGFEPQGRAAWPALLARPGAGVPFAAPRHVLMQVFIALFDGVVGGLAEWYRPPGKRPRDYGQLDRRAAAKLAARLSPLAAVNERVTVRELLTGVGLWSAYKHHPALMPSLREAILRFRHSDQAQRQLGQRSRGRQSAS